MLLSPGHSPRHISTPTPTPPSSSPNRSKSRQLQTLALTLEDQSSSEKTTRKRSRSAEVLDEDSYVNSIEKIIERDFFPDIPKLRDRLDWLEAVRSGDPVVIRDAQLKILERRAISRRTPGTGTRCRTQTPSSSFRFVPSATPLGSDRTPSCRVRESQDDPSGAAASAAAGIKGETFDDVDVSVSLDEFFRMYTSEDNESFNKIMEKVNKRRKEKYAHLLKGNGKGDVVEENGRITDGYGTSDQPLSTLEGWNYTAKNLLMYNAGEQSEAPLTVEEMAERLKGMTKEIRQTNTRFHSNKEVEGSQEKAEGDAPILYSAVPGMTPEGASWPFADREAEKTRKYDLEDLRKTPNPYYVESSKMTDNGYRFVKTPSPAPGAGGESPFMTWGEIEGTPLRLDLEDTPIGIGGSANGPRFSIPLPPSRDVKAHSLSREAAKKLRERSKLFQKPPLPSPSRSGSMSPCVRTLSPAAQKFVRNAIAKSSHSVDETLRASYRGNSPVIGTPKTHLGSSRFGKEASLGSRSPSARKGSTPPW